MRSVLFVITGFGGPNKVEEKLEWLNRNIKIINKNSEKQEIKLIIFCYDNTQIPIPDNLNFEVEIINRKGFVFQFLYEVITPEYLQNNNFDYFHSLMDDITLAEDYNLDEVLNFYESENCDIIQHALEQGSSGAHMDKMGHKNGIYFSKAHQLEFFSYIMNYKNYKKYYQLLNEKSRCGWGLDVIIKNYFRNLILFHKYPIYHYISGDGYENQNFNQYEEYYRTIRFPEHLKPLSLRFQNLHYENQNLTLFLNYYISQCQNILHYNVKNVLFSQILANSIKNKQNTKFNLIQNEENTNIGLFVKESILDDIDIEIKKSLEPTDMIFIENFKPNILNFCNKYAVILGKFDNNILDDEWCIEKFLTKYNLTILRRKNVQNRKIDDFGFVISRHVNSFETNRLWNECITKIRHFYPDNKILIIDDNSNYEFVKNTTNIEDFEFIQSEYPGRGELLPYYYFHKLKSFEKAIILQDSVFIQYKFNFEFIDDVKFIWSFEHHWDNPEEEIKIIQKLNHSDKIIDFYHQKNLWKGCFGSMSVIDWDFLNNVSEKYNLFELLNHITDKGKRMSLERVLASIFTLEMNNNSLIGDIHQYIQGKFHWGYSFDNYTNDKNKQDFPIIKVW